jgi:nucleotide sugar dehydrogenase
MVMKIGFIGQGWIGKNYADSFEDRGFDIVRYSKEISYLKNKEKIQECDYVFIAVPTPSTPEGFDDSIVREAVKVVGKGKVAVIKSTLLPGAIVSIQEENPDIVVLHSPEFLREISARFDVDNPERNIIGLPKEGEQWLAAAREVMKILPKAPYEKICTSNESELIKYGGNNFLYWKVIYMNLIFDFAQKYNCDWNVVAEAMAADSRIGSSHMQPFHDGGRGAGGHCFIKDFAAFHDAYREAVGDELGLNILESLRDKNIELLLKSGKNLDLLEGVYGAMIQDSKFKKK